MRGVGESSATIRFEIMGVLGCLTAWVLTIIAVVLFCGCAHFDCAVKYSSVTRIDRQALSKVVITLATIPPSETLKHPRIRANTVAGFEFLSCLERLEHRLEALNCNAMLRLLSVKRIHLIESGFINQNYGDSNSWANNNDHPENALFIIDPNDVSADRIVIILSSVSPDRTSVIAIDDKCDATLIYDTFHERNIAKGERLNSIIRIQYQAIGKYLLQERPLVGMAAAVEFYPPPRQYRLTVDGVTCEIDVVQ